MTQGELDRRIQTVLDGEATAKDVAELERTLAADPASRARYDEWRSLFAALRQVPERLPPEGLVAAVTANIRVRPGAAPEPDQHFTEPRVFGATSAIPGPSPVTTRTERRAAGPAGYLGDRKMSDGTQGTNKRAIVIGVGLVAAAAAAVVGLNLAPSSQDTAGTIVPA